MVAIRWKVALIAALFSSAQLMACTGISLTTQDHSNINGRTVEFGVPLDLTVAFVPRNTNYESTIPSGKGMQYTTKYAMSGIYCFDEPVLMDGINEEGLVVGVFYFPGYASYSRVAKEKRSRAMSPIDFPNWILSQFSSIEEVKENIKSVVIAPTVYASWGKEPPPFHYIVYDRSGKSIVIEPLKGEIKVYDNPVGTITNSPGFDWHLANLNNYINLTPYNARSIQLRDRVLTAFGEGSGMLGLPGDFTPPSRFVRATLLSAAMSSPKSSLDGVYAAFHLLNQFDIPYGVIRQGNQVADYTCITTVKDVNALKYYYKTFDDQTIRHIDMKQFNPNAKTMSSMKVNGKQPVVDVSKDLK